MKKILTILISALLLISLFSCRNNTNNNNETTTTAGTTTAPANESNTTETTDNNIIDNNNVDLSHITITSSLSDIMKVVYNGVDTVRVYESEITADNVAFFLGLESADMYTEALSSDAEISAQAHSVCLVRVAEGQDVEEVKNLIYENADPNKWICVFAEEKIVDSIDDVVILIMDSTKIATRLHENFLTLK